MSTATHRHDTAAQHHSHAFVSQGGEQRVHALGQVALLTLAMMAVELFAGYTSGSLALTADGWHMGSHAGAIGGAWLAARLARQAHEKAHYAFGGWKIEVLAGYSSALLLAAVALGIAWDGVLRLLQPAPVAYEEAMVVAVIGLAVNLASAWLLARGESGGHGHAHGHGHSHGHAHDHRHAHTPGHAGHAHHDHNFRAAYLHVVADALTSVLAIAALAAGLWWQLWWADAVVGLFAAVVIGRWSLGLLRDTARALVDATSEAPLRDAVRAAIEADHDAQLTDLHVWQVGPQAWSAALTLVADAPLDAAAYRARLAPLQALRHITVEVHRCSVGTCTGDQPR